jgi:RIO kinase 1
MQFLGKNEDIDNWEACPRLKDAELPAGKLDDLYVEMLYIVRRMYKICKLVHADLSEYNVIYNPNDEHLYTFDVSQSVEHDHPHAFDFLRADISNVDEFFSRRGVRTLGIKRTFNFTIESWGKNGDETEEEVRLEMERLFEVADGDEEQDEEQVEAAREKQEVEDSVFKQSYIPRTLNEVYDPERDAQRVIQGEREQLIYANVAEVVAPKGSEAAPLSTSKVNFADDSTSASLLPIASTINGVDKSLEDEESSEGSEEEEEDDDDEEGTDEEDDEDDERIKILKGKKHEDKDAKKERKQAVKEEKREKRKEKIPKNVKKAKIKKGSGKKK